MVASQKNNLLWKSYFEGQEKANDLAALHASIDVIAQEEVSRILTNNKIVLLLLVLVAHLFKHMEEVGVLAMNITEYLNWRFKLNKSLLFLKYFHGPLD